MKKTVKRILIGLSIGLLILLLVVSMFNIKSETDKIKFKSETDKMTPLDTQEIVEGVYSIKDSYVNLFLIKSGDKYIAIDAGNNLESVKQEMEKLNIDHQKVVAVFLTHSHADHVGALELFKNATIYISREEEQMINRQTSRFSIFKNKLNYDYELVEDNQIINISDLKIKGILTPGHTPGSMCYLINDKYLFTGDTMSLKSGNVDVFNDFFNMDTETQRKSLKKLTGFPEVKYIFTAHYGFTDNYKKAFNNWNE